MSFPTVYYITQVIPPCYTAGYAMCVCVSFGACVYRSLDWTLNRSLEVKVQRAYQLCYGSYMGDDLLFLYFKSYFFLIFPTFILLFLYFQSYFFIRVCWTAYTLRKGSNWRTVVINANSITHKRRKISAMAEYCEPHLMLITGTKLDSSIFSLELLPKGYVGEFRRDWNSNGGGIMRLNWSGPPLL